MIRKVIKDGRAKGVSEETVKQAAMVSAHSGLDVMFDESACFVLEDGTHADGAIDIKNNRIIINPKAKTSTGELILLHELTHAIYNSKSGVLTAARGVQSMSEAERESIKKRYEKINKADKRGKAVADMDEINAHYAAETLSNKNILERLVADKPGLKDKVLNFFKSAFGAYKGDVKLHGAAKKLYNQYKKLFDEFSARNHGMNSAENLSGVNDVNLDGSVIYSLSKTKVDNLKKDIEKLGNLGIRLNANNKNIHVLTDEYTKNKNIFSDKGRSKSEVNARIKAIPYFSDIIKKSVYRSTDTEINGIEKDAKKGVKAIHRFSSTYKNYDVEILIRDKGSKQFLYELKFIEKQKSSQQSMTDKSASTAPYGDVENNDIIHHTNEKINTNNKKSAESSSESLNSGKRAMFAGEGAKGANVKKLSRAKELAERGEGVLSVRRQTGWFRGIDGKWRFEIDDKDMQVDTRGAYSNNPDIRRYTELVDKVYFNEGATEAEREELHTLDSNLEGVSLIPKTLGETIKHEALFNSYPNLKNIPIIYTSAENMPNHALGAYGFGEILLSEELRKNKENMKAVLIHEIQHIVQETEGFSPGTNRDAAGGYDAYFNTAGEIEARDAANRRNLTDEQRKNTEPDIYRSDAVLAENESFWASADDSVYDSETASISEQIKHHQEELNKLGVVASASVPTRFESKQKARIWAIESLKSSGYQVDKEGFGTVYFNPNDINNGLNYADTDAEKAAFAVLNKVIKRGIVIEGHFNHKGRKKQTITIAAPVELNRIRGNMAVVVNKNGNHYYAHRILLPDGRTFIFSEIKEEARREPYRGVAENSSLANTTSLTSNDSIPQTEEKSNTLHKKSEGKADSESDGAIRGRDVIDMLAKDGFSYRTAYFEDFDGQYYKITLSIGQNGTEATVYNVGKIKKDSIPSATKIVAVVGSKPLGKLSNNSISQIGEKSNGFEKKVRKVLLSLHNEKTVLSM